MGCLCTCARADRVSVSQERLGRLGSILVCGLGFMNWVLNTSHGWGISARAHVQTALLYLRNGLADWVQFWCVSWGSWTRCLTQVMGGICSCARAHGASVSQKRFDRLCSNLVCGLGVTKYVLSTSHGWGGASLHVRTCNPPPSPYLRIR